MYSLGKIAQIVDAQMIGDPNCRIQDLQYDSRKTDRPSQSLFIALVTSTGDGHVYLKELAAQGLCAAMVNRKIEGGPANQLIVSDSLQALQLLAAHHRKQFHFPIIAVTGSNGKTIVKEWLYQIFSANFRCLRSPKSFNSQLGVPLSLWPMNDTHELAIIEAGISQLGEMTKLQEMIQPTLGIFTHLGDAHGHHFQNEDEKLQEKLQLFKSSELVICEYQDSVIQGLEAQGVPVASWGENVHASFHIQSLIKGDANTEVDFNYRGDAYHFSIPFVDRASFENAMHCICIALHFQLNATQIQKQLNQLVPVDMRLQQLAGTNNCSLILDYYNSDFASLRIALDFLNHQAQHSNRTVILSDITESEMQGPQLYAAVDHLLQQYKIDRLIGIGPDMAHVQEVFRTETLCYLSTEEFMQRFPLFELQDADILLKGSRPFRFERIAELLSQKVHQTVLEVNMSRLKNNLKVHREALPPGTKVMAMVKAYGYGSGGHQLAKWLEYIQVDYLGLAYIDEAVSLRMAGVSLPMMILNPDLSKIQSLVDYQLEPAIHSMKSLNELLSQLGDQPLAIHLEFDTGMHRLGLDAKDLPAIREVLSVNSTLEVRSVYSHLASADDASQNAFTQLQIERYTRICKELELFLKRPFIKHLSNTAGIQRHPAASFDMVRLGLGLYGLGNEKHFNGELHVVGTFKSYITQIREVPAGDGIGYGQHDRADHARKIAVIAVGYADGYNRAFSQGKGYFLINGQRAPVVGNVCMDMSMCDVSEIRCEEGDEAIIFGDQPTVEELATILGTIPYEVLTSVSERVSRVFYQEQ